MKEPRRSVRVVTLLECSRILLSPESESNVQGQRLDWFRRLARQDANLWATETMNNAAYPLELLQRVITVSLETMKIVDGLPELDID
jgi:hypothetical protein